MGNATPHIVSIHQRKFCCCKSIYSSSICVLEMRCTYFMKNRSLAVFSHIFLKNLKIFSPSKWKLVVVYCVGHWLKYFPFSKKHKRSLPWLCKCVGLNRVRRNTTCLNCQDGVKASFSLPCQKSIFSSHFPLSSLLVKDNAINNILGYDSDC